MGLEDDMLHGAAQTRDDIEPPRPDGMPRSADERYLRRLLAVRVAMPGTYYDDGEAQGQEHGISIDFMREPVADIDAKLRALNVARIMCAAKPPTVAQFEVQACRPEDRAVLATPAGAQMVAAVVAAMSSETPNGGVEPHAPQR